MPTIIGHSTVGLAVNSVVSSRPHRLKIVAVCVICSVIPDLDSLGFRLGIPYGHWLGHRGFSHSLLFAVAIALIASFFVLRGEKSLKTRVILFAAFIVSVALHDVLDAMTNGGLGVAFFSPFSNARYFLPWRPIEVSPISPRLFLASHGWKVMTSEFVWVIVPSLAIGGLAAMGRGISKRVRASSLR